MRLLLVDALNLFIRNFTVNPSMDSNGEHVGGVVGTLTSLNMLVRDFGPDRAMLVWDGEGGSLRRCSIYKHYKEGRKPPVNRQYDHETVEDQVASFSRQVEMTRRYVDMLPVVQVDVDGLEADDVIAYVTRAVVGDCDEVVIVSSDGDYLQLVSSTVSVYSPTKKRLYTSDVVEEELGVLPCNVSLMKAVVGDRSDNIRGVSGVGERTFVKMFPFVAEREATLSEILEHANGGSGKRYEAVSESASELETNYRVVQLESAEFSGARTRSLERQCSARAPSFRGLDLRLALTADGLSVRASDFFKNFESLHRRQAARR